MNIVLKIAAGIAISFIGILLQYIFLFAGGDLVEISPDPVVIFIFQTLFICGFIFAATDRRIRDADGKYSANSLILMFLFVMSFAAIVVYANALFVIAAVCIALLIINFCLCLKNQETKNIMEFLASFNVSMLTLLWINIGYVVSIGPA